MEERVKDDRIELILFGYLLFKRRGIINIFLRFWIKLCNYGLNLKYFMGLCFWIFGFYIMIVLRGILEFLRVWSMDCRGVLLGMGF